MIKKGLTPNIDVATNGNIGFLYGTDDIIFDVRNKQFHPLNISVYAEDFRDFLRRNGFPFYGGGFFESIEPKRFAKAKETK